MSTHSNAPLTRPPRYNLFLRGGGLDQRPADSTTRLDRLPHSRPATTSRCGRLTRASRYHTQHPRRTGGTDAGGSHLALPGHVINTNAFPLPSARHRSPALRLAPRAGRTLTSPPRRTGAEHRPWLGTTSGSVLHADCLRLPRSTDGAADLPPWGEGAQALMARRGPTSCAASQSPHLAPIPPTR